jgi:hypothetical protein
MALQGHCFDTMSLLRLTLLRLGNVAPISVCLNALPKMAPGGFVLSAYVCLARYRLLLVQLLTFTTCRSDNKHDLQQNAALAIVRTSAPREIPMALKLSATAVVESERNLPLLLSPTHRPPIFDFSRLPNYHSNALFMSIFIMQI